ncbi:MAG TPA: beta-propeller fold lactonase family protein [Candidatus Angelobacter sp.]|nr:beta-propeller fold lactonase family protein [Candidatus Angelobacter sp.]
MRARTFLALFIMIGAAAGAMLLSGCASAHKTFAYVIGNGTNEVFEFQVNGNGTLTALGQPNFPVGSNPSSLTPHTSGDFLYVANFSGNNLTLLDINKGNGNLSVPVSNSIVVPVNPPNIFPAGSGPIAIVMSPTQPFLFVANQASGDIFSYTVDPGAGGLGTVQGSPFSIFPGSHPSAMAVSPKGNFLFVGDPALNAVFSFAIGSNGALTPVSSSPVFIGGAGTPVSLAVEPSGRFLYAADPANNEVLGFTIQSDGSLLSVSAPPISVPVGIQPKAVAVDPQGTLLFVANSGSDNVSVFVIDASSGKLGQVTGSPFATGGRGPSALAVSSDSTAVYVTDAATNDIAALAIGSDGSLKPIPGSPFGLPTSGRAITLVVR